jgi:YidC/Oxa1 family membrane protein insertase
MWFLYLVVRNYGVALFLFTLLIRVAMFPSSLKQQKSSAKMALVQPKIAEIQKMYAGNKEKINEETMKLYQQEGYNPMSGCLPLLIQMPILFGLIDVIYRPIKHILHLPAEIVTKIEEVVVSLGIEGVSESMLGRLNQFQIIAVQQVDANPAPFLAAGITQDVIDQIGTINLNFLGLNLGLVPDWDMFSAVLSGQFNPLILVPVLSGLSAFASAIISMKTMSNSGQQQPGGGMKGMMLIMPIFSFFIAVSVPAGVGMYWFFSNILAIAQSLILNKIRNPKAMAEAAKLAAEERAEKERQDRIEAKKQAKLEAKAKGDEPMDEKALSQKELNRRKLAEARRRDAEKYGEVYVDVTDDDLR